MRRQSGILTLLGAVLPTAIWFACFSLLYGVMTLACGPGLLTGHARNLSLLLLGAALVALAVVAMRSATADPFLTTITRGLLLLMAIALCWMLAPLLMLAAC
jgi:hypothetical protein